MNRLLSLVVALAAVSSTTPPSVAQVEGSASFVAANTSAEEVDRFLDELRGALAREDRAAVATMLRIPLWVWNGHHDVEIESDEELWEEFDRIFDSTLRLTIDHANSATAFVKPPAVTFDNARLQLLPLAIDGQLRIIAIRRPVPAEGARSSRR